STRSDQLLRPECAHVENERHSRYSPNDPSHRCWNIGSRMHQLRPPVTSRAPDLMGHADQIKRWGDETGPWPERAWPPVDPQFRTFSLKLRHRSLIDPILCLFASYQRDVMITRQPAQIGQDLALAQRLQK